MQKNAMFGLNCIDCKKKLKKLSFIKCKHGAMFGLDARIALAIFGALSVISGAALYSVIGHSKAVSMHTDMVEIGKAWEQYVLDTGIDLPKIGTSNTFTHNSRDTAKLVSDNITGWKGPYLSYEISTKGNSLAGKFLYYKDDGDRNYTFNGIYIDSARDNAWGDTDYWANADVGKCNSTDPCYIWVKLIGFVENQNYHKQIDEIVDNGDGPRAGNVRWLVTDHNQYYLFLKYAPFDPPTRV